MALCPKRLKGRHRGMQSERTVEINHRITRNIDGWPHRIIGRLTMRDHNIQSVRRAALEDHHQPLVTDCGLSRRVRGASQKCWQHPCTYYSECPVAKKDSPRKH